MHNPHCIPKYLPSISHQSFKGAVAVASSHTSLSPDSNSILRFQRKNTNWNLHEIYRYNIWLVVWLPFLIFPYIGLLIIPIDFHIFQRGGPTTNQIWYHHVQSGFLLPQNCGPDLHASSLKTKGSRIDWVVVIEAPLYINRASRRLQPGAWWAFLRTRNIFKHFFQQEFSNLGPHCDVSGMNVN